MKQWCRRCRRMSLVLERENGDLECEKCGRSWTPKATSEVPDRRAANQEG